MSSSTSEAAGALNDPIQQQRALNIAARFHTTRHEGFVPQAITDVTSFPIYPPSGPIPPDRRSPSIPSGAAIYQSHEEPQHRGYDVDVSRFLSAWSAESECARRKGSHMAYPIGSQAGSIRLQPRSAHIRAADVSGDNHDMQGFDWASLGTTRAHARAVRSTYCRAVQLEPARSEADTAKHRLGTPAIDLFRFHRMNTRHRAWIQHFQLRNAVGVASHSDVFYLAQNKVHRTDPLGNASSVVMDVTAFGEEYNGISGFGNTALAVSSDVIVTGSALGQYALASLTARHGTKTTVGFANTKDALICHVELYRRRGQARSTTAAFASNDDTVRLLDCATNTFLSKFDYSHAINCTSTDPYGQMRVVVGDSSTALITAADTGKVVQELKHHSAHMHATSWSADGIHLATGAEDRRVLVYDARNWSKPIADIMCETACPRSLKFSPQGSTSPSLLIAEAEDVVSVVDATAGLFNRKQNIEFFGTIAGIDWRPDGRTFWVANADAHFGGLMEFERNSVRFAEAEAVGSMAETRNERARTKQREREVKAQKGAGNRKKRSSWQISSSGSSPEPGQRKESGSLSKRRSLQFTPSPSNTPVLPAPPAERERMARGEADADARYGVAATFGDREDAFAMIPNQPEAFGDAWKGFAINSGRSCGAEESFL